MRTITAVVYGLMAGFVFAVLAGFIFFFCRDVIPVAQGWEAFVITLLLFLAVGILLIWAYLTGDAILRMRDVDKAAKETNGS
jgi:hypothetical protein